MAPSSYRITVIQTSHTESHQKNGFLHNCSPGGKKPSHLSQTKSKTLKQKKQKSEFLGGFILKATSHLLTATFLICIIQNQWLQRLRGASCAADARPSQPTAKVKRRATSWNSLSSMEWACATVLYQLQVKKPLLLLPSAVHLAFQSFWHHAGSLSQQLDPLMSLLA